MWNVFSSCCRLWVSCGWMPIISPRRFRVLKQCSSQFFLNTYRCIVISCTLWFRKVHFYRTMLCRARLCDSMSFVLDVQVPWVRDHIGWNTSKIILCLGKKCTLESQRPACLTAWIICCILTTLCIQRDVLPDESSIELGRYLVELLIPRTSVMLAWWEQNKARFPLLASVARTYLGPPASNVPSVRLLITAGGVFTEHRARLLPDNAERLIFLKYNASLIKSE